MQNFRQIGHTVDFTAAADTTSGQGVLWGALFGVAATDVKSGERGALNVTGVFDLPKAPSQAWTDGQKVYWDDTNKRVTTAVTGNTLIGVAIEAVGGTAAETTGRVRLNGAAV